MNARTLAPASLLLGLLACSDADAPQRIPPESAPLKSASNPKPAPAAAKPSAPAVGPLSFTAPKDWTSQTPEPPRKAQYKLAHAEADADDAQVTVINFGRGQGGSVEDNIARWASQFEQPDGRKTSDVLMRTNRKVNGMDILEVDISGTCLPSTIPGTGNKVRKEGWRMLTSMIGTTEGAYFVKLLGPVTTVSRWEASYRQFVDGAKAGK